MIDSSLVFFITRRNQPGSFIRLIGFNDYSEIQEQPLKKIKGVVDVPILFYNCVNLKETISYHPGIKRVGIIAMLMIRKEQIAELRKISVRNFEEIMFKRVQKYFPNHYRVAGESAVREVIQLGIERAYNYGFKSQRNVGLYIILMFMLGPYFDEDMIHQNLAGKLQGKHKSISQANACMNDIVDAAQEFISNCLGPEDNHINRVLLTLKAEPERLFCNLSGDDNVRQIRTHLEQLFPAKAHFLSEEKQRVLISLGQQKAKNYDFRSYRAQSLFLSLMFITHSFFDLDPLFPLINKVLHTPVIKQQKDLPEKLYDAALKTLEKWLKRP